MKITKEHISVKYDNWRNRIGSLNEWELFSLIRIMPYYHHSATCVMNGETVSAYRFWHELVLVFCSKYNIELRNGDYIDGKDDYVVLIFHGDSLETIEANEKCDSHWYTRKDTWVAPTFDGSVKSDSKLKVNILVQDECDEKGNVTKSHQVMVVEGDNANTNNYHKRYGRKRKHSRTTEAMDGGRMELSWKMLNYSKNCKRMQFIQQNRVIFAVN